MILKRTDKREVYGRAEWWRRTRRAALAVGSRRGPNKSFIYPRMLPAEPRIYTRSSLVSGAANKSVASATIKELTA